MRDVCFLIGTREFYFLGDAIGPLAEIIDYFRVIAETGFPLRVLIVPILGILEATESVEPLLWPGVMGVF